MIFVDNENITDPRINLAIEEHLLRNVFAGEDLLLFYVNAPSIIIGRNQNTLAEINPRYVDAHGIIVVRRLSGGGAVYHDLGNLNFSFITRYTPESFQNFRKFTGPVIRVLHELGVPAEPGGRSDIVVAGRKVSGNAQYRTGNRMWSHGTLLFDSRLEDVASALDVSLEQITARGIQSVRSRVANISEFLSIDLDIFEFRRRLIRGIFDGADPIPQYKLTPQDWAAIQKLSVERYASWEWNYGKSLAFDARKERVLPTGKIEAHISTDRGLIQAVRFSGDFAGAADLAACAARLAGVRYERADLEAALAAIDLTPYVGAIDRGDLLNLLW